MGVWCWAGVVLDCCSAAGTDHRQRLPTEITDRLQPTDHVRQAAFCGQNTEDARQLVQVRTAVRCGRLLVGSEWAIGKLLSQSPVRIVDSRNDVFRLQKPVRIL